jgi:hypothetical protein
VSVRRFSLLAAATLLLGVAAATAQTVIVTSAPPNSSLEVVLNGNVLGTPTAGADGSATVVASGANALTGDIDAFVFVDTCSERRRVIIAQRDRADVPADAGCTRQQVAGLFLVRPVSTVVVRVPASGPTLVLRHGPYNPSLPAKARVSAPKGFVFFGGAGLTVVSDAPGILCGNVSGCSGDGSGIAYSGGVAYWFTPYLAAEGTYLRPGNSSASGSGTGYQFDSSFQADVFTIAGVFGIPAGAARVFGKGGVTYHQSLYSTTQTNEDTTITVDEETQVIPGGTMTIEYKTQGWGWFFGGGVEVWISRRFAIYGEGGWAALKGSDPGDGHGTTDDSMLYVLGGLRFRIGKGK